jgi:hypothetical protein
VTQALYAHINNKNIKIKKKTEILLHLNLEIFKNYFVLFTYLFIYF